MQASTLKGSMGSALTYFDTQGNRGVIPWVTDSTYHLAGARQLVIKGVFGNVELKAGFLV